MRKNLRRQWPLVRPFLELYFNPGQLRTREERQHVRLLESLLGPLRKALANAPSSKART